MTTKEYLMSELAAIGMKYAPESKEYLVIRDVIEYMEGDDSVCS